MVKKSYNWDYVRLDKHTECKHKILRDYIHDYIVIRCRNPLQTRFKLAFIDGFCGGGRYSSSNNAPGSPLIFVEELRRAYEAVKLIRINQGIGQKICFECWLFCVDSDRKAVALLKKHIAPLLAEIRAANTDLDLKLHIYHDFFENKYPVIKEIIQKQGINSVLCNLDPCSYTDISTVTLSDIMCSFKSVEIFYTFMLGAALRYKDKTDMQDIKKLLMSLDIPVRELSSLERAETVKARVSAIENLLWNFFQRYAPYVSALSMHYEGGYQNYWLLHFAKYHEARSAYNNVLHRYANGQIHIGGIGLLAYHTKNDGISYLFGSEDREKAGEVLQRDAYNLLCKNNEAMEISQFLQSAYRNSLNHSEDIKAALIENPEIEIITTQGGERRKQLKKDDIIRLKPQKSFFFLPSSRK